MRASIPAPRTRSSGHTPGKVRRRRHAQAADEDEAEDERCDERCAERRELEPDARRDHERADGEQLRGDRRPLEAARQGEQGEAARGVRGPLRHHEAGVERGRDRDRERRAREAPARLEEAAREKVDGDGGEREEERVPEARPLVGGQVVGREEVHRREQHRVDRPEPVAGVAHLEAVAGGERARGVPVDQLVAEDRRHLDLLPERAPERRRRENDPRKRQPGGGAGRHAGEAGPRCGRTTPATSASSASSSVLRQSRSTSSESGR